MPRNNGIYSPPPGTGGTPQTTISSAMFNAWVADITADQNNPRPIIAGGTGATTAAGALANLAGGATGLHAIGDKATPADADDLALVDSADGWSLKKLTWANLKATLASVFLPLSGGTLSGSLTISANDWTQITGYVLNNIGHHSVGLVRARAGGAAVQSGDILGGIFWSASNGTVYPNAGQIRAVATSDWSVEMSSEIHIWTYDDGAAVLAGVFRQDGRLTLHAGPSGSMDAATKAYVDAAGVGTGYVSAEQTITSGGSLTLAHGLGVKPQLITYRLVCTTAEHGYSVGDEVDIAAALTSQHLNGSQPTGMAVVVTASDVKIKFGSNVNVFAAVDMSTGGTTVFTNANWRLIVRAFA